MENDDLTPPPRDRKCSDSPVLPTCNASVVGDPEQVRPFLDVDGFDQNLDDLFVEWSPPTPAHLPENDFKDAFDSVVKLPLVELQELDELYVYTDGSFGETEGPAQSTWAFCALGFVEGCPRLVEWYGDFVSLDPLDTTWIGATEDSIRSGEATALIFSALWILQLGFHGSIAIESDSWTNINVALGHFGYAPGDPLGLRLRAVYHFLQQGCRSLTLKHVRAHSGIFGNELADRIAVRLREQSLAPRSIPRTYALWFHGTPPRILQTGFIFDFTVRPVSLPPFDGQRIYLDSEPLPEVAPDWLRPERSTQECDLQPACLQCCSYNVNTLKGVGIAAFLREQFAAKKLFLAGLQETRSKESTTYDSDYIRLIAPADQGHGGTELWISTTLPYGWHGDQPAKFARNMAQVLHAEAEILIASLDFHSIKLLCIVAHGPHRGHPAPTIEAWWKQLQMLCGRFRHSGHPLIFIDANARISAADPWFGDSMEQPWDTAGRCMLELCKEFQLYAPSTFSHIHVGDGATWHGHQIARAGTRNDYLLVSQQLSSIWGQTWIDRFLDSGNARLDHSAVVGSFWFPATTGYQQLAFPTFDRQKILKADATTWGSFFDKWENIPWDVDVDTHALRLEEQIVERLGKFFPREPRQKRNSIFSDHTWKLFQCRAHLRRLLTSCCRALDAWQLHVGILTWTGRQTVCAHLRMLCLCIRVCGRYQQLTFLNKQLRKQVMIDKATKAEELLEPLQQAHGKAALRLLKPLKLGKRHRDLGRRTLPIVRLANGDIAASPDAALQRWRDHFGAMEGGTTTSPLELWSTMAMARSTRSFPLLTLSDLPHILELEAQLRKTRTGKSPGPDAIPGEFLRAASPWLANELYPLLLKVTCRVQEPMLFKGGRLATLYKGKGSPSEVSSHRAILISSMVGKTFHNVFRDRVLPFVRAGGTDLQYSNQPGALVALAAHSVRLHQNWAKNNHSSEYTLFIDIASAYYTLLRQMSVDVAPTDENIILMLRRLGISECHVTEVAKRLELPTGLEESQTPPHLRAILGEFHSYTWFRLRGDEGLVATSRGTRPGDGLADILWSISFGQFLQRVEDRIQSLELHQPLRWNREVGLRCLRDLGG